MGRTRRPILYFLGLFILLNSALRISSSELNCHWEAHRLGGEAKLVCSFDISNMHNESFILIGKMDDGEILKYQVQNNRIFIKNRKLYGRVSHEYNKIGTGVSFNVSIKNITKDDEGMYIFDFHSNGDSMSRNVNLTTSAPWATGPANQAVLVGESLLLKCAMNVPNVNVSWKNPEGHIVAINDMIADGYDVMWEKRYGRSQLLVKYVDKTSAGTYTCLANHSDISYTASAQVIVLETSRLQCHRNRDLLMEHVEDLVVVCEIEYEGLWAPHLEWRRKGISHFDGSKNLTDSRISRIALSLNVSEQLHDNSFECIGSFNQPMYIVPRYHADRIPRFQFSPCSVQPINTPAHTTDAADLKCHGDVARLLTTATLFCEYEGSSRDNRVILIIWKDVYFDSELLRYSPYTNRNIIDEQWQGRVNHKFVKNATSGSTTIAIGNVSVNDARQYICYIFFRMLTHRAGNVTVELLDDTTTNDDHTTHSPGSQIPRSRHAETTSANKGNVDSLPLNIVAGEVVLVAVLGVLVAVLGVVFVIRECQSRIKSSSGAKENNIDSKIGTSNTQAVFLLHEKKKEKHQNILPPVCYEEIGKVSQQKLCESKVTQQA